MMTAFDVVFLISLGFRNVSHSHLETLLFNFFVQHLRPFFLLKSHLYVFKRFFLIFETLLHLGFDVWEIDRQPQGGGLHLGRRRTEWEGDWGGPFLHSVFDLKSQILTQTQMTEILLDGCFCVS